MKDGCYINLNIKMFLTYITKLNFNVVVVKNDSHHLSNI